MAGRQAQGLSRLRKILVQVLSMCGLAEVFGSERSSPNHRCQPVIPGAVGCRSPLRSTRPLVLKANPDIESDEEALNGASPRLLGVRMFCRILFRFAG
jgi:hypothetical protein